MFSNNRDVYGTKLTLITLKRSRNWKCRKRPSTLVLSEIRVNCELGFRQGRCKEKNFKVQREFGTNDMHYKYTLNLGNKVATYCTIRKQIQMRLHKNSILEVKIFPNKGLILCNIICKKLILQTQKYLAIFILC